MRGWLVVGAFLAIPAVSAGSPPLVTIGAMGGSAETRALLRRLLIQELGTALGAPTENAAAKGTRFELQGTITRLVRLPDSTGGTLRCQVSLILIEKPGGSVRAFLSGTGHLNGRRDRAVEAPSDASDVEEAVRIAVRGALRRLPAVLGSVEH